MNAEYIETVLVSWHRLWVIQISNERPVIAVTDECNSELPIKPGNLTLAIPRLIQENTPRSQNNLSVSGNKRNTETKLLMGARAKRRPIRMTAAERRLLW